MFISQALALENLRASVIAGEEVAPAVEAELDSLLLRRRAEGVVDQLAQVNLWQILVRLELSELRPEAPLDVSEHVFDSVKLRTVWNVEHALNAQLFQLRLCHLRFVRGRVVPE